jgi:ABC-type lipoprotein export system ATPase subunit
LTERERDDYRRYIVGHAWQQSGRNLIPDLTLAENVALPQLLAGRGAQQRRRRSAELLEQVGLGTLARKRPDQLSGGEQQRGAIAVALANGPRLLLADEPTDELDAHTASEIVALVHSLTRTLGLTAILVTHDLAVAAEADRTIAMRDGRTSTETVRREQRREQPRTAAAPSTVMPGTGIGLPDSTHRESVLLDQAGRLQLPEAAMAALRFEGRADLRISRDHAELWPVGAREAAADGVIAPSAVIGLPMARYRESILIDRVGRFQLSEEALERVPFGRHATIRIQHDHLELWPLGDA